MTDYTIVNEFTLPSKGLVYPKQINPQIKLRSMTTAEEMKRLNSSDRPYKNLADIIDDCLIDKPGISSYDMCLGDFQYLLHKLRVVTYGTKYRLSSKCPHCGFDNVGEIDLNEMSVSSYTDEVEKYFDIELPISKNRVRLRMQTPRMLDDINVRVKEITSKRKSSSKDSAFLLNIESVIDTVDGSKLDVFKKSDFVKQLPMADINYILASMNKINELIGLDMTLSATCDFCGLDYDSPFRITPEFFRPSIDI
jgi:hypothetical protein